MRDFANVSINEPHPEEQASFKRTLSTVLFFILAVDPELDYLNIYDDECMWDKIEERIREEKEYFNKDLIFVEKDYCEAFGLENKRKNLW